MSRFLIGALEPEYVDVDPEPGEYGKPPLHVIRSRLEPASQRFTALADTSPISAIYGFYDVTPDYQPIIGRDPRIENLIHMVGLSGHGFKLAPAYGDIISDIIVYGRSRRFNVDPFSLDRFEVGGDQRSRYKYGIIG